MPALPRMTSAAVPLAWVPFRDSEQCAHSVLYVDDDWQNLAEWCATLEGAGYCVTATDSPAAALRSFAHGSFDAVVLNFHLPYVTSGLLAQVIRTLRRDIPLLLVSDCLEDEDLSPWDRRLSEGVDADQFLASLHSAIEHGRRARIAATIASSLPPVPLH
jgi:CheY-like chemotaxis protein